MSEKPKCFGDYSDSYSTQAERSCHDCPDNEMCVPKTHDARVRGMKQDQNKPRYSLLPLGIIYQIIAVLEFGARRYEVDNWQH